MRVFSPSVGKRVIALMPDFPAVSFAQLSALPAPSEVTTPRPVTTTIGRPSLSVLAAIFRTTPSADDVNQRQPFAAPVSDPGHHNLPQLAINMPFQTRRVAGRKETTMTQHNRGQGNINGKLRLKPVSEIRAGRPNGKI